MRGGLKFGPNPAFAGPADIALEKQLLEREATKLRNGPAQIELQRKIKHLETAARSPRLAFLIRSKAAELSRHLGCCNRN